MSRYGRNYGDLAYGDDYYGGRGGGGGGGERWDRDRFEREMRGGDRRGGGGGGGGYSGGGGRESFSFREEDYHGRGGDRKDIRIDIDEDRHRRGSGRDPYRDPYGDDRYDRPQQQRPQYLERDRYEYDERQLAPYRSPPQSGYGRYAERDFYDSRPSRPQYIRRQSSLNFDDRRPRTRYGDEEERDVNVNVNFRGAPEPPRRQSPRPEPPRFDYDQEDYGNVRIFREKDREVYRR